jgi:hypothetical protein
MIGYKTGILIVASLFFIPAIIAGGGFIIAAVIFGAIVIAGIGGPKLWQLHNNKSLGAKSRGTDMRDVVVPGNSQNDGPKVQRGDGEEP